jgi:ribonuclease HII
VAVSPTKRSVRGAAPTREFERELAIQHGLVAAIDEVGRGALAGPVTVGVVLVDVEVLQRRAPAGLRDSKLLLPAQREALIERIDRWVCAHAVAHADPQEIDAIGIIAALRRAGERALAMLPHHPSIVLLDGSYDWLTRPEPGPTALELFADEPASLVDESSFPVARRPDPHPQHDDVVSAGPAVITRVKADMTCASVAAASVLAKVQRDALMVDLDAHHPEYGWRENKGYAAPTHRQALQDIGMTRWHRQSWRLLGDDDVAAANA